MNGIVRPTSVTVVAVLLLIFAALGLLGVLFIAGNAQAKAIYEQKNISFAFVIAQSLIACGITVAASIAMLIGQNWGRWLYLIVTPINMIIGFVLMGIQPAAILGVGLYVLFLVLLTRPKANGYFAAAAAASNTIAPPTALENTPPGR